jgi:hypothetical protein
MIILVSTGSGVWAVTGSLESSTMVSVVGIGARTLRVGVVRAWGSVCGADTLSIFGSQLTQYKVPEKTAKATIIKPRSMGESRGAIMKKWVCCARGSREVGAPKHGKF